MSMRRRCQPRTSCAGGGNRHEDGQAADRAGGPSFGRCRAAVTSEDLQVVPRRRSWILRGASQAVRTQRHLEAPKWPRFCFPPRTGADPRDPRVRGRAPGRPGHTVHAPDLSMPDVRTIRHGAEDNGHAPGQIEARTSAIEEVGARGRCARRPGAVRERADPGVSPCAWWKTAEPRPLGASRCLWVLTAWDAPRRIQDGVGGTTGDLRNVTAARHVQSSPPRRRQPVHLGRLPPPAQRPCRGWHSTSNMPSTTDAAHIRRTSPRGHRCLCAGECAIGRNSVRRPEGDRVVGVPWISRTATGPVGAQSAGFGERRPARLTIAAIWSACAAGHPIGHEAAVRMPIRSMRLGSTAERRPDLRDEAGEVSSSSRPCGRKSQHASVAFQNRLPGASFDPVRMA